IYGTQQHISIASLGEEIKARTIVVNGVSKTYAMTGFRIGFAAGPTEIIKAMINAQSQSTSGANTPSMHAATVALNMPQDCVETMRKAFHERRDALVKGINAIPGVTCQKPEGAFYVMMNVSALMGKRYGDSKLNDCTVFADTLLTEAKVSTVPGSAFMAEGFCRLSYATSMVDVLEGIRRIEAFVKALV
ncbi:MAG: aminotransferase class I/II-fold pyridoxal phosphate-dependent enzyme, partial [Eubacteriales bacterium]|nr:aminotransferase class I/II-fold pyridoxal phosphate-dependent enzyme [Eubacteriales bacterium]